MRSRTFLVLITLLCAHLTRADGIRVTDPAGKSTDWSVEDIKQKLAADLHAIEFTARGEKHTANCVSLLSVVRAAGVSSELKMDPKIDPKLKNFNLRLAVVVQGSDGYRTVLSVGELLPDIGNRPAWLALDTDGGPLSPREAPAKLIVPDDAKPGRWVRGVTAVSVVDPTAPTTQPAK